MIASNVAVFVIIFSLLPAATKAFHAIASFSRGIGPTSLHSMGPLHTVSEDYVSSSTIVFDASLSMANAESFLTNSDVWVFVAGMIPFVWATIEFWRRIAVGEPFGTGSDSVIIGEDNNPDSSRGRRVLGTDALVTAYILFGMAAFVVGVVLYSVVTSGAAPAEFVSAVESSS
jgi:hypothetical protein